MKQLDGKKARTPQIKFIKFDNIKSRLVRITKVNTNPTYERKIKEKLGKVKIELNMSLGL